MGGCGGRCRTSMAALPTRRQRRHSKPLPTTAATSARAFSALNASSPEVGSSANSSMGREMSSTAILSRFFSPPLRPRVLASPTRVPADYAGHGAGMGRAWGTHAGGAAAGSAAAAAALPATCHHCHHLPASHSHTHTHAPTLARPRRAIMPSTYASCSSALVPRPMRSCAAVSSVSRTVSCGYGVWGQGVGMRWG